MRSVSFQCSAQRHRSVGSSTTQASSEDSSMPTTLPVLNQNDEAQTLHKLATALTNAASLVDRWAKEPGSTDLAVIRAHLAKTAEKLTIALDAHLESDASASPQKLRWVIDVLTDKVERLTPRKNALFFDHREEVAHAREQALTDYDAALQALQEARKALAKHPDCSRGTKKDSTPR